MKIPDSFTESQILRTDKEKVNNVSDRLENLIKRLVFYFRKLAQVVNGQISFGDGTDSDNIDGVWISTTSNAIANAEFPVTHNLGRVPAGYLIMSKDDLGIIYDGTTSWTDSTLYLRCNVASMNFKVFVF